MLRQPSINEPTFYFRVIYDLLFYVLVIIIVLNLVFGVIIDTFADLRGRFWVLYMISEQVWFRDS